MDLGGEGTAGIRRVRSYESVDRAALDALNGIEPAVENNLCRLRRPGRNRPEAGDDDQFENIGFLS